MELFPELKNDDIKNDQTYIEENVEEVEDMEEQEDILICQNIVNNIHNDINNDNTYADEAVEA